MYQFVLSLPYVAAGLEVHSWKFVQHLLLDYHCSLRMLRDFVEDVPPPGSVVIAALLSSLHS